jgi:hypothetical protein
MQLTDANIEATLRLLNTLARGEGTAEEHRASALSLLPAFRANMASRNRGHILAKQAEQALNGPNHNIYTYTPGAKRASPSRLKKGLPDLGGEALPLSPSALLEHLGL